MPANFNPAGDLSLKGRLQFLLRDATLYGGAAAISKAFALITFPLLARYFSVAEYGLFDYFQVLGSLLAIFFIFGQDSAVARYFYEYEETDTRQQLVSQSLVFQLSGLALFLPLLWIGSEQITGILIAAHERVLLFKIVLLQLPFLLLINFSQNLLKWTFARARFLTMSLGYTVVQASLLVVAVLVFDVGVAGVLVVSLATSIVFGALGLFFVRKWLARPRDFSRLREMLPFAIPYGIICVAGAFSPTLERTLTIKLLSFYDLGLYAAATKIAMLMGVLASAFQTAWGPFSLSLFKQADAGETFNLVFRLFATGACITAFSLSMLAEPLIRFLATDRYSGAAIVVFPLVLGLAIQAISWISEIGISISKRSYLNLYAYSAALTVTFASICFFAPLFGLLGVGFGVLLGYTVRAVISSWLAQHAYKLPWHYTPVISLLLVTLCYGISATWLSQRYGSSVGNLLLVVGLVTVVLMGWLFMLNRSERFKAIAMVRKKYFFSNYISWKR